MIMQRRSNLLGLPDNAIQGAGPRPPQGMPAPQLGGGGAPAPPHRGAARPLGPTPSLRRDTTPARVSGQAQQRMPARPQGGTARQRTQPRPPRGAGRQPARGGQPVQAPQGAAPRYGQDTGALDALPPGQPGQSGADYLARIREQLGLGGMPPMPGAGLPLPGPVPLPPGVQMGPDGQAMPAPQGGQGIMPGAPTSWGAPPPGPMVPGRPPGGGLSEHFGQPPPPGGLLGGDPYQNPRGPVTPQQGDLMGRFQQLPPQVQQRLLTVLMQMMQRARMGRGGGMPRGMPGQAAGPPLQGVPVPGGAPPRL